MLFICGIHGVGKSYFCQEVKNRLNFDTYSASSMIAERKHMAFSSDKLIPDIDDNQQYLLEAIDELNSVSRQYILDGHLCLLDANGAVQRISLNTFTKLKIDAILLLTEKAEIIAERRAERDRMHNSIENIRLFQAEEFRYASEIGTLLNIPIHISPGIDELDQAILFVETTMRRIENGGEI